MSERSLVTVSLWVLTPIRLVLNSAHRFVYPFLPVIARGLGIPLESAGTLLAARWGITLTTPLVIRAIGSEHRRRLIVAGLGMFAAGALVTTATSVWIGALLGFSAMGLGKALFDISAQAHVADHVPYARRGRSLAVLELTWAGGFLIGAPAAGWLIDRAGWQSPFWLAGAVALASVAVVMRTIETERDGRRPARSAERLDRSSAALLAAIALLAGSSELMFTSLGAWLEGSFGLSILVIGGVATVLGLAELSGELAVLTITDRIGKRRAVAIGLVVTAMGYVLTALFHASQVPGIAAYAVALVGFEFTIVSAIPLATEVQPMSRARFLSLMIVALGVGRALGAYFGPRLYESAGVAADAWVAAAGTMAALVVLGMVVETTDR